MNYPMIRSILGFILGVEALFMTPALGIALFRSEGAAAAGFGITMAVMALVCLLCIRRRPPRRVKTFFMHTFVIASATANTNLTCYNGKDLLIVCYIINLKNVS